jgi:hypothetical protein
MLLYNILLEKAIYKSHHKNTGASAWVLTHPSPTDNLYGGEGGIRTHGPLRSHWFSRPAP